MGDDDNDDDDDGGITFVDHYKVLGLKYGATNREITKAYRNLARKVHPDRNKGNKVAADKFVALTRSYEILTDAKSKNKYDEKVKKRAANEARNQKRSRDIRSMRADLERREREAQRATTKRARTARHGDATMEARVMQIQKANEDLKEKYEKEVTKESSTTKASFIRKKMGIVSVKWKRGGAIPSAARLKQGLKIFGNILDVKFIDGDRKALVCFESTISARSAANQKKIGKFKVSLPKKDVSEIFEGPVPDSASSLETTPPSSAPAAASSKCSENGGANVALSIDTTSDCYLSIRKSLPHAHIDESSAYVRWLRESEGVALGDAEKSAFSLLGYSGTP